MSTKARSVRRERLLTVDLGAARAGTFLPGELGVGLCRVGADLLAVRDREEGEGEEGVEGGGSIFSLGGGPAHEDSLL